MENWEQQVKQKAKNFYDSFTKEPLYRAMMQLKVEEIESLIYIRKKRLNKEYRPVCRLLLAGQIERLEQEKRIYEIRALTPVQKSLLPITDDLILRAKQVSIEAIVGVPVKKVGGRKVCKCPIHQEKTPSFVIYPDNKWFCFGACHKGGDAISLYQILNNVSFVEAVKRLTNSF